MKKIILIAIFVLAFMGCDIMYNNPTETELKGALLELNPATPDFSVNVRYGEPEWEKILGFYKAETKDIFLFLVNLKTEDDIMFAAIHEFAHHVHSTRYVLPKKGEDGYKDYEWHNGDFQAIMDGLLRDAKGKGIYKGDRTANGGFIELEA